MFLSLRELRSTTCGLETVLLSLLHSGVTSEKASLLEKGLVGLVCGKERTSNTVTDSTCLAGEATTVNVSNDVELTLSLGYAEGLVNDELKSIESEVIVDISAVDGDNTGAGIETNSCNGLFSSTCAVEIGLCTSIQNSLTSLISQVRWASEQPARDLRLRKREGG